MLICQACSAEISGRDRFCRGCGIQVAALVGDLVETHRFNPAASPSASAQPELQDPTNPFYVPPHSASSQTPAASYQTGAIGKKWFERKLTWLMIFLLLSLCLTTGIILGRDLLRSRWAAQAEIARQADQAEQAELARRYFEEAVQNALGLKQGNFSESDFSEVRGIFINSLMSDDGPAAVANLQAGDVLMELGEQVVRNESELAKVLDSLKTGDEVAVKFYRDGAISTSRIKIADRSFPPLQVKIEPRDQGFLGIKDSGRRCCVPGTKKWGVEVKEIHDNSPADLFGLKSGDLITQFNGHAIRTPNEFNRRIRAAQPRSQILVKFYRGNTELEIKLLLGHRW
jgi:hypothetical protein